MMVDLVIAQQEHSEARLERLPVEGEEVGQEDFWVSVGELEDQVVAQVCWAVVVVLPVLGFEGLVVFVGVRTSELLAAQGQLEVSAAEV